MITADHDSPGSFVGLKEGEVEITHCFTFPQFRKLGIYPYAIRSLCQIAAQNRIRRVFMITNVKNIASQQGIEKAWHEPIGQNNTSKIAVS
jgi:hypothetical protein